MNKDRKIMRRLFCDWHMPAFLEDLDIDAEYLVEQTVKMGAQSLNFMCKSAFGNCLYPSEVEYVHPSVKKRGDIFGKVCNLAKEHGLEFIAYYNMTLNNQLAEKHPDWKQVDKNGKPLRLCGYHVFCMNCEPFRERVFRTVEEITQKYEVDGFYFDLQYFHPEGCFCRWCKEKFYKKFAYELNPSNFNSIDQWLDFNLFLENSREDFIVSAKKRANLVKPNLVFTWNGSGRIERSHIELDKHATLLGTEAHPPHYSECMLNSKWMQASGKHFGFCMPETIHSWGDWTLVNPETLKIMCGITMAHGGSIEINHVPMPIGDYAGKVFPGVYDVISETMSWLKQREECCIGKETLSVAAVLHSVQNLKLKHALDNLHGFQHKFDPEKYKNPFDMALGCANTQIAARILNEMHIPSDLIYNENCLARLNEYELLVLPNVGYINDGLSDSLKNYVKNGGCLLSTYNTSLLNEKGEMLNNFKLADVFGVDFKRFSEYSVIYLDRFKEELGQKIPVHPLLIKDAGYNEKPSCKSLYCRLHDSAEAIASFTEPAIETDLATGYHIYHDHAPPGKITNIPAIVINKYGKGTSIFMPFPFFQAYKVYGSPWLRILIKNCLNKVGIPRKVGFSASSNIQIVLSQDENSWYLHLLNVAREANSILLDKNIPSGPVTCCLKPDRTVASVKNALTKDEISYKEDKNTIHFTVSNIKEYEIIEVNFKK